MDRTGPRAGSQARGQPRSRTNGAQLPAGQRFNDNGSGGRRIEVCLPAAGDAFPPMRAWIDQVRNGFAVSYHRYPWLAYGTDWLAFGHITIAVAFAGPIRDPVRNKWVVQFGMIACALVIPLAAICGPLRGIPLFWMPIDMSFGIVGILLLIPAYRHIRVLEASCEPV